MPVGRGYRATLFHLGAVRRLHEVGLLARLDAISSVSGGSVFAAVLADLAIERGWQERIELDDYERLAERVRAVTATDLRTVPFLRHVAWNWIEPRPRVRELERLLARHVSARRLDELPRSPRFVLCATDLTHGASWSSRAIGSAPTRPATCARRPPGRWRGRSPPQPASRRSSARCRSARRRGSRGGRAPRGGASGPAGAAAPPRVALSDGGVYDNLGFEPVWKSHDCLLVSDGGATFDFQASSNPVRRLLRYTSVATNQVRALRYRMLHERFSEGHAQGATWSLRAAVPAGRPGYPPQLRERLIEAIRTDLDRFTAAEQRILENHGYCVAAARLDAADLTDLPLPPAPPPRPPHPEWMDEQRATAALRLSDRRMVPRRLLGLMR